MTTPIPLRPEERKELAHDAKELLDNPAFTAAILALRRQWFAEWQTSADENMDRLLKARIQALEAIPQQLRLFINDQTMADHRAKK